MSKHKAQAHEELIEILREDIRNIEISHKEGKITQEEYAEKMNAYAAIAEALNS